MKTKLLILAGLAIASSAHAGITLNTTMGIAADSSGNAVPDGTLYALVVDTNSSNSFVGGISLGESISTTIAADAAFVQGQAITLGGMLGGDTIFYLGGFNGVAGGGGAGFIQDTIALTLNVNGVVAGRNTALYYFPGVTYDSVDPTKNKVGTQVGGLNAAAQTGDFTQTMVMPADGATGDFGFLSDSSGGTTPNFQAVNLTVVPEPSAALLGALGALGLLRRRRN